MGFAFISKPHFLFTKQIRPLFLVFLVKIQAHLSFHESIRVGNGKNKINFAFSILPFYLRKTKSIETLIPWLYLKGISTGGFTEALAALVGHDAPGLSASTISRLKIIWEDEYQQWQNRDLYGKHFPKLMKRLISKDAGFIKQQIF